MDPIKKTVMTTFTDSWVLPDTNITETIVKGDGIKLKNELGEKFWVNFQYEKDGHYIGKVDNHLILESSYNYGDLVSFQLEHIWQVNKPKDREMYTFMLIKQINKMKKKLGRMPTVEEVDSFFTMLK